MCNMLCSPPPPPSCTRKMLRNEEVVKEKAVAVLDILRSDEMKRARAMWLDEALERSLRVETDCEVGVPGMRLFLYTEEYMARFAG